MSEQNAGEKIVGENNFRDLIAERVEELLTLAHYLCGGQAKECPLTRPLLGKFIAESTRVEEFLDAYGARNNQLWHVFRSRVATIKCFATAGYELLHILYTVPLYRLLPIEGDFSAATAGAIEFTGDVILRACSRLTDEAARLGLDCGATTPSEQYYREHLPVGQLPHDRSMRKLESVAETVARLATASLNVAAETELVNTAARAEPEEYASLVPEPVSEGSLRYITHRIHNLQSLYDSYVSETETESLDSDLPVLRGHISVVFHLLSTATAFVHYYERHGSPGGSGRLAEEELVVDPQALLAAVMNYSIVYASRYLDAARRLCHSMLKRYAEIGRVEVPVPRYRGFHVRPSTLVAKIVRHYGSEVRMELDGEPYDAGTPFDIFRANEKINAWKRNWLAENVGRLASAGSNGYAGADIHSLAIDIVQTLSEAGKVIIYEKPLVLGDSPVEADGSATDRVIAEVKRLQATGKIDIVSDLSITFIGDKRVLADLKVLADHGYGEDNLGNNIPLPDELAYLRR